jgi:hypothetical protein
MLDFDDAFDAVVRHLEGNIVGVGYKPQGATESDTGKKILSAGYFNQAEKAGRVYPAPPDPKWVLAHVPSLTFWPIGFAPNPDYHIKKKVVDKDFERRVVTTKEEFYRAKVLCQAEMYCRSNWERTMMLAQLSTLLNVQARGTGRIPTAKGNFIYLKMLEGREPQEPEQTAQSIYRLVMTWELRVRDLVTTEEPMFLNQKYILKYNGTQVVVPSA